MAGIEVDPIESLEELGGFCGQEGIGDHAQRKQAEIDEFAVAFKSGLICSQSVILFGIHPGL